MRIKRVCPRCGSEFWTGNGKAKYCSKECAQAVHKEQEKIWRKKNADRQKANIENWNKKHPGYGKEYSKAYYERHAEPKRHCVCVICGKEFQTRHKEAVTCSKKCSQVYQSRRRSHRRYELAKQMKVLDKDITLEGLYERDNGICHVCGEPCDYSDYTNRDGKKVYGNSYPSIDHVIPVSEGGTHSWKNVKLAHMICNSRRGAARGC